MAKKTDQEGVETEGTETFQDDTEREKQMELLRNHEKEQAKADPNPIQSAAEQGLKNAEEDLARDPNSRRLQEEVEVRRQNLEKAKRR